VPERPESVTAASRTDDRVRTLVALRDTLARAVDNCDSLRDLSSLSARLTDVLEQIESLRPSEQEEGDPVDEITARRAARGAIPAAGASRAGTRSS
jgi:hypothetical protein